MDVIHTWALGCIWSVDKPNILVEMNDYLRSMEVTLEKPWKLLVNTVPQTTNDGYFSYSVCRLAILRGRSLPFLEKFLGHLRLLIVKY